MTDQNISAEQLVDATSADEIRQQVEEIQTEAKRTFSLRERLRSGVKQKRKVVPVFLDLDAVQVYAEKKAVADEVFRQAERPGIKDELRANLLTQHDTLLDEMSAARERMLESTLSIHLVGLPNKVVKATRSKVLLGLKAEAKGRPLNEQEIEDGNDLVKYRLLALGIERIVQSDGSVAEQLEDEDIRALEDELPTVQWDNLSATFDALCFSQQATEEAVNEPGF